MVNKADSMSYARANLFVGKYQIPEDGWIRLDKIRLRFLYGHEEPDGWREGDEEAWLIVESDDFWPVMVRLEKADLEAMSHLLFSSVKGRLFNSTTAFKGD